MYCLTCACVDLYAAVLGRLPGLQGIHVKALHGRMKQAARESTLASFASLPSGTYFTSCSCVSIPGALEAGSSCDPCMVQT